MGALAADKLLRAGTTQNAADNGDGVAYRVQFVNNLYPFLTELLTLKSDQNTLSNVVEPEQSKEGPGQGIVGILDGVATLGTGASGALAKIRSLRGCRWQSKDGRKNSESDDGETHIER